MCYFIILLMDCTDAALTHATLLSTSVDEDSRTLAGSEMSPAKVYAVLVVVDWAIFDEIVVKGHHPRQMSKHISYLHDVFGRLQEHGHTLHSAILSLDVRKCLI
uniref:Uncharacterized protein n=1 Tax=Amphimedon queenslandica TaxID=400682 RepID=A0A1X7VRI7_AMPQE